MSAEAKKKRGESGRAKAGAAPFRLNGGGCYPLYLRGILGPAIAGKIGRPMIKD